MCCLNQLVLSPEDGPLVAKLMDVYFTFFKVRDRGTTPEVVITGVLVC